MTSVAINQRWVFHDETIPEETNAGVIRRVLAYSKDAMCVESTFKKGAAGLLQCHPQTQITYVASGSFECEIGGVRKILHAGDSMLKQGEVVNGCTCLEDGVLLDVYTPMHEEFID